MNTGYVKLRRSDMVDHLVGRDIKAFTILYKVALRANRDVQKNAVGLSQFQAFIGKNDFPGMTISSYRRAKGRLEKSRLANFKRAFGGTIATLMGTEVFDINAQEVNDNRTESEQSSTFPDLKSAPNKKKKKNKEKEEVKYIVEFLNESCKKDFKYTTKSTVEKITSRLKEGYTLENFQRVITTKKNEWMGKEMDNFLRPETLFGNKFESYLNQNPEVTRFETDDDKLHNLLEKDEALIARYEAQR